MEPKVGKLKFSLIYLLTGIGAGLVSISFQETISVGASGAIYGLFGWFIAASFIYSKRMKDAGGIALLIIGYIGISFLFGLIMMQIDHFAHFGGLGIGLVLGMIIRPNQKKQYY